MKHWNKISEVEELILVVAFSDISNFSKIVNGMTNIETFAFLQKYRDLAESFQLIPKFLWNLGQVSTNERKLSD